MSRLEQYVKESVMIGDTSYKEKEIEKMLEVWEKLSKDCKPFLKELRLRNKDNLLYRGSNRSKDMGTKNVRDDRVPKDMPEEAHEALDDAFDDIYGWKARSQGLFCTGRIETAKGYGTAQIIFPIGRYEYLWSDTLTDLYSNTDDGANVMDNDPDDDQVEEWRDDYDNEYGEDGNGSWLWTEGNSNSGGLNKEEFIDTIQNDMIDTTKHDVEWTESQDEPDEDELDKLKSALSYYESDDYRNDVEGEIEWEPYQDWDSYLDDMTEDYQNDRGSRELAESIIRGEYTDSNLLKGLQHSEGTEIMVRCKKYYFFHTYYKDMILKLLFDDDYDPR